MRAKNGAGVICKSGQSEKNTIFRYGKPAYVVIIHSEAAYCIVLLIQQSGICGFADIAKRHMWRC